MNDYIAGTFGGMAGVFIGHPLDTIKVRIQSQDRSRPRKYGGMLQTMSTIMKEEKVFGLYRGMSSPLIGVAFINSLLFGIYSSFFDVFQRYSNEKLTSIFFAGCASGFINAFFSCPMELVKIRLQNQHTTSNGVFLCCHRIYATHGYRGFYKGLHATLLRETPSYGVYFVTFELLANGFQDLGGNKYPSMGLLLAGGFAGVAGWLSTYPFDVIKTRIQTGAIVESTGICLQIISISKKEGFRSLFSGLGPTIVRAFPTNAATFYTVALIKNMLNG
ncbi:solute carrier family 25 member 45 [Chytridium lagenaria]|nr:solute carrier family 25 member 45 [Chytridium lagenaria]